MSLFKAQAHMRELKQRLQLSMASAVFTDSFDTNSMPIEQVVNAGETNFIKIEVDATAASARVDGLGLAQQVYSPHKVTILRSTPAGAADYATRERIVAACAKLGMKLDIYEQTGQPSSYNLAGATLVVELRSDEINPLTQSQ
jgi:hypothetical protein